MAHLTDAAITASLVAWLLAGVEPKWILLAFLVFQFMGEIAKAVTAATAKFIGHVAAND